MLNGHTSHLWGLRFAGLINAKRYCICLSEEVLPVQSRNICLAIIFLSELSGFKWRTKTNFWMFNDPHILPLRPEICWIYQCQTLLHMPLWRSAQDAAPFWLSSQQNSLKNKRIIYQNDLVRNEVVQFHFFLFLLIVREIPL